MADVTAHELQARSEGVEIVGDGRKVTFMGDQYRMSSKVGLMPLMRFAQTSKGGADSDDMEGLAAMYTLIKDCIDPDEWARFERDAIDKKAEADELFKVVADVIAALTARPTQRPAVSSDGPPTTSENLKGISSSTPVERPGWLDEVVDVKDLLARSTV